MTRVGIFLAAAGLIGCTLSRSAERTEVLRLQQLQGTVADLEQRVAFEATEKEALTAKLRKLQEELGACRPEADTAGRRAADLGRRLGQCEEAEAGLRADQDLGRRARAAAEQERDDLRQQAQAAGAECAAQEAALRRELEDCRGRLADAESQASLLVAERRTGELVAREKVDEVSGTYDRLLEDARAQARALTGKVAELEAAAAAREAFAQEAEVRLQAAQEAGRSAEAERVRREEERVRFREALAAVLGEGSASGGLSLVTDEARAAVRAPVEALFTARTTELKPGAREALKRLADLARQADASVQVEVQAAAAQGELAKRFPTLWDLAGAYAAKVARLLEKEGGLAPGRLVATGSRPVGAPVDGAGALPRVTIELRPVPPASEGQ